jgi:hypothetical protein
VTAREFRNFANATGYISFAGLPPGPKNYAGALPHILKGGSRLCVPNYCRRYRAAARNAEPVDTSRSPVGSFPLPRWGKAYFRDGNANTVTSYGGQRAVLGKTVADPTLAENGHDRPGKSR